jgi:hypothetical protein
MGLLDNVFLAIDVDMGANIVVVQRGAKKMGVVVRLSLRVLQLLSAGRC